ncbi:MAG: PilN domain-containing protein [Phycisphaerae bacterium]|nr:PilN domain-containing protein [Phycisphaerae bacterium]
MMQTTSMTSSGGAVLAAHWSGSGWAVVVVRSNGETALLDHATFERPGVETVGALLRKYRVSSVVVVAGGHRAAARVVSVPAGDAESSRRALALMAEAEFGTAAPEHRRGAGVVPDIHRPAGTAGEVVRSGMLIAWRGDAPTPTLPVPRGAAVSWTTELVALAMLRSPSDSLAWAGVRGEGTELDAARLMAVASGPSRLVARCTIQDASSEEAWMSGARDELIASLRASGCVERPSMRHAWGLNLGEQSTRELLGRVRGVPKDPKWLDTFGFALGGALAAVDDGGRGNAPGGLAGIRAEAPRVSGGVVERGAVWISRPRNATWTLAAALILALLGPWLFARARLMVLELKLTARAQSQAVMLENTRRAALYGYLEQTRWPMTKLMADISRALPVGVTIEELRLAPEQGVFLAGAAPSTETLAQLQESLNRSGVFGTVRIDRAESTEGAGISFQASATVTSPNAEAPQQDDFAVKPLAVRLYGAGASNTTVNPKDTAKKSERSGRAADGQEAKLGATKATDAATAAETPKATGESKAGVPVALSDAAIAKLDRREAMREFSERSSYVRSTKDLDRETKDRLEGEITKLREQMRGKRDGAAAPSTGGDK